TPPQRCAAQARSQWRSPRSPTSLRCASEDQRRLRSTKGEALATSFSRSGKRALRREVRHKARLPTPSLLPAQKRQPVDDEASRGARYRIQFTADQAYLDLLEEARELLQRSVPDRDLVEVQRRALHHLVKHLRARKLAVTVRPRPVPPSVIEPASALASPSA